jgi:hypothetical protein
MFTRNVTMHLKPKSVQEFTKTIENDVLPVLRKQKGFKDELTFIVADGSEALAISLWDYKADADAYDRGTYPQVLKALSKVIEGTPQVRTYDVSNSTFHKISHVAV